MSASELRAELKALRKEHPDHAPVSRMKKNDVSALIQRMKAGREETPPVASITSAPAKTYKSAVTSVKEAKAAEFPLEHVEASAPKKAAPAKPRSTPKKEIVAAAVKVSKAKEVALKATGAAAGAPIPRPAKGSDEMKAKMAAIRVKRGSKKE
jgi:Tfp pilus assembly protein PilV